MTVAQTCGIPAFKTHRITSLLLLFLFHPMVLAFAASFPPPPMTAVVSEGLSSSAAASDASNRFKRFMLPSDNATGAGNVTNESSDSTSSGLSSSEILIVVGSAGIALTVVLIVICALAIGRGWHCCGCLCPCLPEWFDAVPEESSNRAARPVRADTEMQPPAATDDSSSESTSSSSEDSLTSDEEQGVHSSSHEPFAVVTDSGAPYYSSWQREAQRRRERRVRRALRRQLRVQRRIERAAARSSGPVVYIVRPHTQQRRPQREFTARGNAIDALEREPQQNESSNSHPCRLAQQGLNLAVGIPIARQNSADETDDAVPSFAFVDNAGVALRYEYS